MNKIFTVHFKFDLFRVSKLGSRESNLSQVRKYKMISSSELNFFKNLCAGILYGPYYMVHIS